MHITNLVSILSNYYPAFLLIQIFSSRSAVSPARQLTTRMALIWSSMRRRNLHIYTTSVLEIAIFHHDWNKFHLLNFSIWKVLLGRTENISLSIYQSLLSSEITKEFVFVGWVTHRFFSPWFRCLCPWATLVTPIWMPLRRTSMHGTINPRCINAVSTVYSLYMLCEYITLYLVVFLR